MGLNRITATPLEGTDYSGFSNLFSNVLQGYKNAREPKKIRQEEEQREHQNKIFGVQAEHAPMFAKLGLEKGESDLLHQNITNKYLEEEKQANIENTKALAEYYRNQGKFGNFSANIKDALVLQQMRETLPPNDPRLMAAEEAFNLKRENEQSIKESRDAYKDTIHNRFSSPQARLFNELEDINAGFLPGTNRQTPINEEQQEN